MTPDRPVPAPITTGAALHAALDNLAGAPYLCVDTEFERNRTYFPRLCLVQLAVPGHAYLIDPVALPDLTPLEGLLSDARTVKVLHSARQDLEILLHRLGRLPEPLFDTQIAAAALGLGEQLGYAQLVHRLLGVPLDKGQARTDWCARPLGHEQLRYAADDVIWLCPAYEALREALAERGRIDWVLEDSARLADPDRYAPPTQEIWRKTRGLHNLPRERIAVLRRLAAWREEQAMAHDLPRRWVIPDEALVALAAHGDPDELGRTPGLSERRLKRWGPALRSLLHEARTRTAAELTPATLPERLTPEQQSAIQAAMREVRALAERLETSPSYLASRGQVTRLLLGEEVPELTRGWRARVLGDLKHLGPHIRAAQT